MRPHERIFIDSEIKALKDETLYYWNGWNIYDWLIIACLLITTIMHIIPGNNCTSPAACTSSAACVDFNTFPQP